jgi:putative ABC transport system permease protein
MTTLTQHLRHAIRGLRRSPAFTLTVIATLGIGIGLNAAIFTVVDCVLLRPLGYRDADRIVALETHITDKNVSYTRLGGGDYIDAAQQVHGLESTAYWNGWTGGVKIGGQTAYLPVASVSPGFGQVMGVQPVAGRLFNASDAKGRDALISESLARAIFGSAQAALGQGVLFDGELSPIVGVLPSGFSFPEKTSVWIEFDALPPNQNRTAYNQLAVAKRRADVSPAQLAAELATFSARLQRAYPEDHDKTIISVPLQQELTGYLRPTFSLLMGAVAVILLIVCANLTHLQLVRATRQLRTVTICTALGASRLALAARSLTEAILLAAGGLIVAIVLAIPALQLLIHIAPRNIPRLAEIHLNLDVLLFSFALSALLMAVTAVLPVWRSWHVDPASALRQDAARGTEGRGTARLRNSFLIAEIALTLTLSVAAVMLTRELIKQSRQELGFSPENLVTLDTHTINATPPPTPEQIASATPAQVQAYTGEQARAKLAHLRQALDTAATVPGVSSVAAISGAPMGFDGSDVGYAVKGRQVFAPPYRGLQEADIRQVTPNLLATLGTPLLRGRAFTADDRLDSPPVLLINQTLARQVFPNQNPIGQQIMCGLEEQPSWWTIVGVVGDIRGTAPGKPASPTLYIPIAQHPDAATDLQIVVRTKLPATAMLDTLTRTLKASYPDLAIRATTMQQNIGEVQRADQFRSLLFAAFGAVSILLAAVGMYGVTSYTVAQRSFEFSLRIALGADRSQLLGMVLRNALFLTTIGIAIGVALSLSLTRVLTANLGTLPGFDAPSYALASLAILAIALLATALPARNAANANPMSILRSE